MSARTRSSARIQALQSTAEDELDGVDIEFKREGDNTTQQHYSLEEKELEIWDEVRDEHYEVIEQLPLTIHRQLALLRQLDGQSCDCSNNLLPAIRHYIKLRKAWATNAARSTVPDDTMSSPLQEASLKESKSPQHTGPISAPTLSVLSTTGAQGKIKGPATSREILSNIAWLSEEYLRISHEKVNLAQTAHDSVDRHIRLLDQFIKEQEASLGPDPNAPVMLSMSDLVVPKWSRSTRVSMSPMLDEEEADTVPSNPHNATNSDVSLSSNKRRPSGSRRRKEKEKEREREKEKEDQSAAAALRITLPAQPQEAYTSEPLADPNEPTWCYCNRVSFGGMIGCDDMECKYEWFHLECAGLKEVPEDDEWYCRECTLRREVRSRRR